MNENNFSIKGVKYKAQETKGDQAYSCDACEFVGEEAMELCEQAPECLGSQRKDGRTVVFVKDE